MQNNNECCLLFDVGGTGIKVGVYDTFGELSDELQEYPSKAEKTKEEIFDNFYKIILELKGDKKLTKIGFAFPGPFDFANGISLMKGINKYDAIYGISIRDELLKRDNSFAETQMLFLHDIEAFARGCYSCGEAADYDSIMCLCIGTGAGSCFIKNGQVIKYSEKGVPDNGWIYNTPFREGIIDDYVSVRGLSHLTQRSIGEDIDGYELYLRCLSMDPEALRVFEAFGEIVVQAIAPFIEEFKPEAFILGGQISKSFAFFGGPLRKLLNRRNIRIILEGNTSKRAMQGLLAEMKTL
ncbi:ROK family protein [Butyrivibrio sp. AE3006]|uniref:ROK family protein n=1 Tax=Butyrivibrio sp. AE3006 TaxID=1280673 RepID=UPI00040788D3|nr:ROK family protein [Butyrivibrio sp. AE3006]